MLTVLCTSKHRTPPGGLEHLGGDYRLIVDDTPGWSASSNHLLDRALIYGDDALFLDDDVTLTADSLEGVRAYRDHADAFGLDLHTMTGQRQPGARHIFDAATGEFIEWNEPGPAYVAHCSTSAIYLSAKAIASGVRFPIWPGVHWEDVAYCLDLWRAGLRVLAVPGVAWHAIEGGVGQTKRHDAMFWARWHQNRTLFAEAYRDVREPRGAVAL